MNLSPVQQPTILIVDDNPTNLDLLLENLSQAGFKVLVAKDGERALLQAELARPEVILLDIMMPGIDGFETCRQLKANEATQDIPVIFMTALNDIDSKVKGFEVGGVDYVTKPFQQEELLARVTTHITIGNLQKSLQEQVMDLDAFAHTVAHDLKNPLSRIIGFAEILKKNPTTTPTEERQEYLQIIARNGRKMSNIIDTLLLLASVRQQEVELTPLDMASIVAEVLQRLTDMIDKYQPEIVLPDIWPVALGYAPWIEEVWVNYLSNALKYGGRPPYVALGATIQADERVRYWVRDNGPGLTPEKQVRLFIPFTRLDQVRVEGYGLGLSIVRRIVEKLGGQVGVESEGMPGRGSVFHFTLPTTNFRLQCHQL